jgi:hypothetical protein
MPAPFTITRIPSRDLSMLIMRSVYRIVHCIDVLPSALRGTSGRGRVEELYQCRVDE